MRTTTEAPLFPRTKVKNPRSCPDRVPSLSEGHPISAAIVDARDAVNAASYAGGHIQASSVTWSSDRYGLLGIRPTCSGKYLVLQSGHAIDRGLDVSHFRGCFYLSLGGDSAREAS